MNNWSNWFGMSIGILEFIRFIMSGFSREVTFTRMF